MISACCLVLLGVLGFAPAARAHKLSDSYLQLEVTNATITGKWDIAIRDLATVVDVDGNADGDITWDELKAKFDEIVKYAGPKLLLKVNEKDVPWNVVDKQVAVHTDGAYIVLFFTVPVAEVVRTLRVEYKLLFEVDLQHRGLLHFDHGDQTEAAVLSPDAPVAEFVLAGAPNRLAEFGAFVKQGVWHIWIGFDHILFLVALLLPSVLRRENGKWAVAGTFQASFLNVLKVVTAFTVAHSITLSLAALDVVRPPSRLIESAIAASVIVAAGNNLFHYLRGREWLAAFVFGLIHGFGFASVLLELGLSKGSLAASLVGFNLGVETGQLAIVALFLPLAFWLRRKWVYQTLALRYGSVAIVVIAAVWMCERAFDVTIMNF